MKSIFPDMDEGSESVPEHPLKEEPAVPEQVKPPDQKNEEPVVPESVIPQFRRMLNLPFHRMLKQWEYQLKKLQLREHMKINLWKKFET